MKIKIKPKGAIVLVAFILIAMLIFLSLPQLSIEQCGVIDTSMYIPNSVDSKNSLFDDSIYAQKIVVPSDVKFISKVKIYWYCCSAAGVTGTCRIGLSTSLTRDTSLWLGYKDMSTPAYQSPLTNGQGVTASLDLAVTPGSTIYIMLLQKTGTAYLFSTYTSYTAGSVYYAYPDETSWNSLPNTDFLMNVCAVYESTVQCWKCSGGYPYASEFPEGTICGQGSAASYPYSSAPDCSQITCHQCQNGADVTQKFSGTTCPSGWYPTVQDCSQPDVRCWKCSNGEAVSKLFVSGTDCADTTYPLSDEPDCEPVPVDCDLTIKSYDNKGVVLPACSIIVDGVSKGLTDSSGYKVITLESGSYNIVVSKGGYNDYSTVIDLSDDSIITAVLSSGGGGGNEYNLSILVLDSGNKPITGANVNLSKGTALFSSITGMDGKSSFKINTTGSYALEVTKNGYKFSLSSVEVSDVKCPSKYCQTVSVVLQSVGIPGFELITVIIGLILSIIILRRRGKI